MKIYIDDTRKINKLSTIFCNLKSFTDKYIIGSRCSKPKMKDCKYCKLHSNHLIHGDYLELPSKELLQKKLHQSIELAKNKLSEEN